MNFVSFGSSHNFSKSLQRIKKEAEVIFDYVMVCNENDLEDSFFNKHKDLMYSSRGFGFWIWKPQIIFQALQCSPEGKCIVYADCGCSLVQNNRQRLLDYAHIAQQSPSHVLGFDIHLPEYEWTKKKTLDLFPEHFAFSSQICATYLVLHNSPKSKQFVKEWIDLCTRDEYAYVNDDDKNPELKDHRHDQSIYSLLSKKHNSITIHDEQIVILGSRIRE